MIAGLLIAGLACIIAGLALDPIIPVNKSLWSGTFVLVTAGLGMSCLALFHGLVDLLGWRLWALPFEMLGSNAIVLYANRTSAHVRAESATAITMRLKAPHARSRPPGSSCCKRALPRTAVPTITATGITA